MQNIDWPSIITAFKNGLTADMLMADYERGQGGIWTIPPCSPSSMERAGRQFSRSHAQSVLHIRRAVLRRRGRQDQAVIVATELPSRKQQVWDLGTSEEVILRRLLCDVALTALETAFTPTAETV